MGSRFEIHENCGLYTFKFVAENGHILLNSHKYKAKHGVVAGIKSIIRNCQDTDCVQIDEVKDGFWQFSILTLKGFPIATSHEYASKKFLNKAIESVRINSFKAEVIYNA